jgi:hypothetical protein
VRAFALHEFYKPHLIYLLDFKVANSTTVQHREEAKVTMLMKPMHGVRAHKSSALPEEKLAITV